jgi:hypothetical protein
VTLFFALIVAIFSASPATESTSASSGVGIAKERIGLIQEVGARKIYDVKGGSSVGLAKIVRDSPAPK